MVWLWWLTQRGGSQTSVGVAWLDAPRLELDPWLAEEPTLSLDQQPPVLQLGAEPPGFELQGGPVDIEL